MAFTKASGLVFSTLFLVVAARLLDPAVFGMFSFFTALVSVGSAVVSGGLTHYWTRQLVQDVAGSAERSTTFAVKGSLVWVFGTSLVICLVVSAASPFYSITSVDPFLLAAALVFSAPISVLSGVMRARNQPAIGELPSACFVPVLLALILFAGVTIDYEFTAYSTAFLYVVVIFLTGAVSTLIVAAPIKVSMKNPVIEKFRFLPWCQYFLPFCLLSTVGVLLTQLATVIVGFFEDPELVANYRIADRLAAIVSLPLVVLNVVLSGSIAKAIYEKDVCRAKKLVSKVKFIAMLVGVSIASGLLLFGGFIIKNFFGTAYLDASYWPMVILIASNLVNVGFGSVGLVLTMAGREREVLREQVFAVAGLFILLAALTMSYGLVGAALSVFISTAFWNYRLHRRLVAWFKTWDDESR